MTDSQKTIFKKISERTLVHIAWDGRCQPDNLYSEYLAFKKMGHLFKFSDIYDSFYNQTSLNFTEHELSIMKYSIEKITQLLIDFSIKINTRYSDVTQLTDQIYDQFAEKFWLLPENEKALALIAPDLWLPTPR